MKVVIRLRILNEHGQPFLGPGPVALLKGIERLGSILAAAREMDMSYTKAHAIVRSLERNAGGAVVISCIGGHSGGGSELTSLGMALVETFDVWQGEVERYSRQRFNALKKLLHGHGRKERAR